MTRVEESRELVGWPQSVLTSNGDLLSECLRSPRRLIATTPNTTIPTISSSAPRCSPVAARCTSMSESPNVREPVLLVNECLDDYRRQ